MSLINDALKKAQAQQRTAEVVPNALPSQEPTAPQNFIRPSRQGPSLVTLILIVLAVASLAGGGVALIIFTFSGKDEAVALSNEDPQTNLNNEDAAKSVTTGNDLEAVRFQTLEPEPAVEQPLPESPQPLPEPPPSKQPVLESSAEVTAQPEGPSVPLPPTANSQPEPDMEILAYLGNVEVRGVLAKTKRVLLYDGSKDKTESYGEGEYFSPELRIRVQQISNQGIIFSDHAGVTYIKYF